MNAARLHSALLVVGLLLAGAGTARAARMPERELAHRILLGAARNSMSLQDLPEQSQRWTSHGHPGSSGWRPAAVRLSRGKP